METLVVFGLLLMLITLSHGVESLCDGRRDGTQCFGALGGTVNIQLMDNVSQVSRFQWQKEGLTILLWRNNKFIINTLENRSDFSPTDGTLKIKNLNKNDGGEYKLTSYNSDGKLTGRRTLQFSVQARVSSVQLVSECLSQGQLNVSCSSEGGDNPQYSWTLDGHTLTDSELVSENNQTNVIVLRENISGRLNCSVRNQVSQSFSETSISTCEFINCTSNGTQISGWVFEGNTLCDEPTTILPAVTHGTVEQWPLVVGVLSALVFFLIVCTTVICAKRNKQNPEVGENDEEIIYSNIRIKRKQMKEGEQTEAREIQQVTCSQRPHQSESVVDDGLSTNTQTGM